MKPIHSTIGVHQTMGNPAANDVHADVPTQKVINSEAKATAMFVNNAQTPYCQSDGYRQRKRNPSAAVEIPST